MDAVMQLGRLPNKKSARIAALPAKPHSLQPVLAQPALPSPATRAPTLPAETLQEIFLYCNAGSVGDLGPDNLPLVLRRVSVTFKAIADSTMGLWSTITITPSQVLLSNVRVIRKWLQRSGTLPLDISICAPSTSTDHSILIAILAEFMPTFHRWQHLMLSIPVGFLPMLLRNPGAPLPMLESLTLVIDYQSHFTFGLSTMCPRDASLFTHAHSIGPYCSQLQIAWEQITHLDINGVRGTIDVIWDILVQCPRLYSLIVTARIHSSNLHIPFHYIYSNISHLTLSVTAHPIVIGWFLDRLYLTHLQELQLIFEDPKDEMSLWPRGAILDLRQRCFPPLKRLAIVGKLILEEDLVDFVHQMKYLERLEVMYRTYDLVTPAVCGLLPKDPAAVLRQRSAYWNDVREMMLHQSRAMSYPWYAPTTSLFGFRSLILDIRNGDTVDNLKMKARVLV